MAPVGDRDPGRAITRTTDRRTGEQRRRGDRDYRRSIRRVVILLTLAYFLFAGLGVGLYYNARQAADARADAAIAVSTARAEKEARLAEKRAGIEATFQACKRSIPTFHQVNRFVHGAQGGFEDLLRNALQNHAATPPSNPQYQAQIRNIARLRSRVAALSGIHFQAPTMKKCRDRRRDDLATLRGQI